ncbi:MAG: hypothetical protein V3T83_16685, partial [Acidobacteriota bacterium]
MSAGLVTAMLCGLLSGSRGAPNLDAYRARLLTAADSLNHGEYQQARRLLDLCDPELRGWEWRHLRFKAESSLAKWTPAQGWKNRVDLAILDPGEPRALFVYGDGRFEARLLPDGPAEELGLHEGSAHQCTASADRRRIACSGGQGVYVFDTRSGKREALLPEVLRVSSLAFHPSGNLLAISVSGGGVQVWDLEAATLIESFGGRKNSPIFNRRGDLIA